MSEVWMCTKWALKPFYRDKVDHKPCNTGQNQADDQ